ncbi:MAG: type II toxin-antitoxin system Phd/YefM family antitoxin [Synergistaceae bacterium]|nr:type II toxin-antitoxin system Phd/YefM family antitoxin [Synergistaceae bacterium]
MTAITAQKAYEKFFQLLSDVNDSSTPIIIVNDDENKNAVLVSEDDWNSLQETLYLYSIPGMVESIIKAGKEPLSEYTPYDPNEEW